MPNPTDHQTNKSQFADDAAIRAEPALSLYGDFLSYYPHVKFLGITFDNRMTFTKHFEEILERCNQKFHRLKADFLSSQKLLAAILFQKKSVK